MQPFNYEKPQLVNVKFRVWYMMYWHVCDAHTWQLHWFLVWQSWFSSFCPMVPLRRLLVTISTTFLRL